ncbi:YlqD protein [Anoxybacillus pushchinoensis]|jgi:CO dehydrogenase/acetyl-CoA synthase gamma subunit (corrinoid Fe-S protein)|uniref:YlqD protein n=1 Tax=Anoxybacillus pushchinoensis TaxID=150248 RepID=A0A1I0SG59_9BACL|nr:YlqD family protein [Anoxybacillus pushchinoensis]SFA38423.1 YlqD protein [Anoxybacillus pushchinoensis]
MKIIQKVEVRQRLTENSKQQLIQQFMQQKQQLEQQCAQLIFEQKRMEKHTSFSPKQIKDKFEREMNVRRQKIEELDFLLEQLRILPIGSEIKERDVEAIIDVQIGMRWESSKTIVIEDGIVVDIREG